MDDLAHAPFRLLFRAPALRLRLPQVTRPSAGLMLFLAIASYGVIVSGIVYDVINEPPSIGSVQDASGRIKPQVVMAHRINGQYIIEGFTAGGVFLVGGIALILLDLLHPPAIQTETLETLANLAVLSGDDAVSSASAFVGGSLAAAAASASATASASVSASASSSNVLLGSVASKIAVWDANKRYALFAVAITLVLFSYNISLFLLRMKVPGYMHWSA